MGTGCCEQGLCDNQGVAVTILCSRETLDGSHGLLLRYKSDSGGLQTKNTTRTCENMAGSPTPE